MIESYASEVGGREVTSLVSELLPVLIDKAGDNNTRIRYGAAAMFGADTHRQNPHAVPLTGGCNCASVVKHWHAQERALRQDKTCPAYT